MNGVFKLTKKTKIVAGISLIIFSILAGFGVVSLKNLKTLYSVMQFLPVHHPALKMDRAVRERFKLKDNPTFIGLIELQQSEQGEPSEQKMSQNAEKKIQKTSDEDWLSSQKMEKLSILTTKVEKMKNVVQVISIANIQGAADVNKTITVGKIISLTPKKMWRDRFLNDQLLTPTLLSRDARTAMIYVQLKNANVNLLAEFENKFREALTKSFPNDKTTVGGVPAVQTDLGILLNNELKNFILLTLVACALTLFIIFRTLSSMLIPLILTAFANVMVFSMMAYTGLAFTVLSSTIPILVFIAVVSISVHVMLRVAEDAEKMVDNGVQINHPITKWRLILNANKAIWLPNLLGTVTTGVGFLTLLTSDVPMIREYGIGVSAAVMLSWALTSIGILPLLALIPMPVPRSWVKQPARWALWILTHRRGIVVTVSVFSVLAIFVGRNLDWTGRLFDDLPENQEARQSTETIDQSMGGIVPMEMVIRLPQKSDWNDPGRIAGLDRLMTKLRTLPGVGSTRSLPDFLKASGLHGSDLPKTRGAVAETYLLYSFSNNNPISKYLTSDSRSARIELKLHDLPADQAQQNLEEINRLTAQEFPDAKLQVGGMGAVIHLIHHQISTDLIFGFWQALIAILILLALVFRSIRWSLVAAFPNLLPPILLLGFLAITHTPIKPSVAIIFSIALGLAFNNTVYVLNRLRSLRSEAHPLPVSKTFYLEGNPCLVSTMVVMMGFSVFLFSYFSLNRIFGACMIVAILAGLIGDLVFLPAMLRLFPWLLLGKKPRVVLAAALVP